MTIFRGAKLLMLFWFNPAPPIAREEAHRFLSTSHLLPNSWLTPIFGIFKEKTPGECFSQESHITATQARSAVLPTEEKENDLVFV